MQVRAKPNTITLKKIIKLKTYTYAEAVILRVIKQKRETVQDHRLKSHKPDIHLESQIQFEKMIKTTDHEVKLFQVLSTPLS